MTIDGGAGAGVVPVMDLNNRNGYGDGFGCGGGWFMWIIVLFAMMGGWGNWGNRNGAGLDAAATFANGSMTRDQIADEFSYNDIKNGIRGVQNGLCDGFYAQNTTTLQGFNGIQRDLCAGFGNMGREVLESRYQLGEAIAANRFAQQQCCCEINRNIDSVRAENYKNTCEITTAIHEEGEKTRALITANTLQDLRDKLADRDRDLQTANFQLSQQAQTANIVGTLRPMPIPAYPVSSPYVAANGCGCNFAGNVA